MRGLDDGKWRTESPSSSRKRWMYLLILFVVAVVTRRSIRTSSNSDDSPFHWKRCSDDPHYLCGYLQVPLDWTNTSDPRTVNIATTLYQQVPGKKTERTLILEPGGPGGSGTAMLWEKGKHVGELWAGGHLDILGFDPRGVNLSSPSISCFPKDAYRDRWEWTALSYPETVGDWAIDVFDAMNEAVMIACKEKFGDIPRFLSTAFVARDVEAIRKALDEETLTAFMGSYGSGIGQTYAQMFPDKVGTVALDGMEYVVDGRTPWDWALTSLDNVTDAFEDGFIGECVRAGSAACSLAVGEPAQDDYESAQAALSSRLHTLFRSLRKRPVPGISAQGPGIVTYERLVEWIYNTMYHPGEWKEAADALASLEQGNATLALDGIHHLPRWTFDPTAQQVREEVFPQYASRSPQSLELGQMVLCSDAYDAEAKSLDWWKDTYSHAVKRSWIAGGSRIFDVLPCRHFDWTPAEVYRGGFKAQLNKPLLLIGGPYDPATPLRNGRRLAAEMGDNARLVVHHAYGHGTSRDVSSCTNAVVQAYILNGTVPVDSETHCYANTKPF